MASRVLAQCLHTTPGTVTWEVADVFIWCGVSYSSEGNNTIPIKRAPQAGRLACLLPNRAGDLINETLLSALHKWWIHLLCWSCRLFLALLFVLLVAFNPFLPLCCFS